MFAAEMPHKAYQALVCSTLHRTQLHCVLTHKSHQQHHLHCIWPRHKHTSYNAACRMLLPEATRAWREGIPTVIVMETGYNLTNTSQAFQMGTTAHLEQFADYPDLTDRSFKQGDMRYAPPHTSPHLHTLQRRCSCVVSCMGHAAGLSGQLSWHRLTHTPTTQHCIGVNILHNFLHQTQTLSVFCSDLFSCAYIQGMHGALHSQQHSRHRLLQVDSVWG